MHLLTWQGQVLQCFSWLCLSLLPSAAAAAAGARVSRSCYSGCLLYCFSVPGGFLWTSMPG